MKVAFEDGLLRHLIADSYTPESLAEIRETLDHPAKRNSSAASISQSHSQRAAERRSETGSGGVEALRKQAARSATDGVPLVSDASPCSSIHHLRAAMQKQPI